MTATTNPLRDFWHPVTLSATVHDKPVGITLLGERVVLWRSKSEVIAMKDRCVHRGTKLSIGWVENGNLVCPYHGWRYGEDGRVAHIPAIPSDRPIPEQACVERYRCTERYGLVYVCLGEPRRPIYEVPEFEQDGFRTHILGPVHWKAGAARSLENFIDEAHLPWAHPGALGNRNNIPVIPSREVKEKPGELYFEYNSEVRDRLDPSKSSTNLLTYHVVMPYELYHENVMPTGERVIDLFYCSPNTATESTRFMVVARNYALDQPPDKFIKFTSAVWEQDRVIVETQDPLESPLEPGEELHMRGPDGPSVIYRRMLRQLIGQRAA